MGLSWEFSHRLERGCIEIWEDGYVIFGLVGRSLLISLLR